MLFLRNDDTTLRLKWERVGSKYADKPEVDTGIEIEELRD
jgi:hypothetical protein